MLNLTPHFVSYTVSKAALWTLTQTMALALAPRIRVNAIGPGPTLPSKRQSRADFDRQIGKLPLRCARHTAGNRRGDPVHSRHAVDDRPDESPWTAASIWAGRSRARTAETGNDPRQRPSHVIYFIEWTGSDDTTA